MDWFLHNGNLRHERINKFKIHNKYIEEMSIDVILISLLSNYFSLVLNFTYKPVI